MLKPIVLRDAVFSSLDSVLRLISNMEHGSVTGVIVVLIISMLS